MLNTRVIVGFVVLIGMTIGNIDAAEPSELLRANRCELESLYRGGQLPSEPFGFLPGTAIFDAGTRKTVRKSRMIHVVWKGKEFPGNGTMINQTVFGLRAVKARVFVSESAFDGQPTLVFDYRGLSMLFGNVRDEVREIEPGVYLGLTYLRQSDGLLKFSNFFVLDGR